MTSCRLDGLLEAYFGAFLPLQSVSAYVYCVFVTGDRTQLLSTGRDMTARLVSMVRLPRHTVEHRSPPAVPLPRSEAPARPLTSPRLRALRSLTLGSRSAQMSARDAVRLATACLRCCHHRALGRRGSQHPEAMDSSCLRAAVGRFRSARHRRR